DDLVTGVQTCALPILLDLQSGAVVWSYAAERFVSSVTGEYDRRFSLWYVSGLVADATTVNLYRVEIRTGERKQMASWRRPSRIEDRKSVVNVRGRERA